MTTPPLCQPANATTQASKHPVPAGAVDCHFHIFDAPSQQIAERSYTAPDATYDQYRTMADTLGLSRGVIVQPSIYGTDNRTTLAVYPDDHRYKRIVVISPDETNASLQQMSARGTVGTRANLLFSGGTVMEDVKAVAAKAADQGWHLQILADITRIDDLEGLIQSLPLPVVFDHMGHVPAQNGPDQPAFQTLLRLLDTGKVWVKLSGAYRVTAKHSAPYSDVAPIAKALIKTNPERLVWGTDWPHPQIRTEMPDDGELMDQFADWVDDPATLRQTLVANPEHLYGFTSWESADDE